MSRMGLVGVHLALRIRSLADDAMVWGVPYPPRQNGHTVYRIELGYSASLHIGSFFPEAMGAEQRPVGHDARHPIAF